MRKANSAPRAFTLIELLVVITIIAILASMLLPVLSGVKKKADMTKAMNNMRQIGAGFMLYSGEHNYALPGRQVDTASTNTPKWPALLAGTDGSGTPNLSTPYISDVNVYICPMDPTINPKRGDLFTFLTGNNLNNTSWIMNGYNDLGANGSTAVEVRTTGFVAPADTILLGVQKFGAGNFYMDFVDGDNKNVLNPTAFNLGSPYLFGDGSVRFILQSDYNKSAPSGSASCYGDWLWLSDKNSNVPSGS